MNRATTATVTSPERYHAIRAFSMNRQSEAAVLAAMKASGFEAGRAKRGGLVISRKGLRLRLTDESGAPELRVKCVIELIDECAGGLTTGC